MFVFALMALGQEAYKLGDDMIHKQSGKNVAAMEKCKLNVCSVLRPRFQPGTERSFLIRNLLSLTITFAMGNYLQGNVFTMFDAGMAGTLAVLLSDFSGSAFHKNLIRLLGLSLGNSVPILMLAAVSVIAWSGPIETTLRLIMFCLFEFYFILMYYTSTEWNYMGCIVAGFGCYAFAGDSTTWNTDTFAAGYKKIGTVTAAMFVQIVVDAWGERFFETSPRQIIIKEISSVIGENMYSLADTFKTCRRATLPTYSKDKFDALSVKVAGFRTTLTRLRGMTGEVEAKTVIVRGPGKPFDVKLFTGFLDRFDALLNDLDVLVLVQRMANAWNREAEFVEVLDSYGSNGPSGNDRFDHLAHILDVTLRAVLKILDTTDESPEHLEQAIDNMVSGLNLHMEEERSRHDCLPINAVVKFAIEDAYEQAVQLERMCCISAGHAAAAVALARATDRRPSDFGTPVSPKRSENP
ncbi:unnamed protein product [Prorocentrum cordatum]|uniref:Hemerythrin-like domain-containing protein n=1 Tax=Prorocentrum cordatum TaxID=2364126 RepID=A0ABN9WAW9_9DINO|nr:unnamed protein product [Polarella glacialis]